LIKVTKNWVFNLVFNLFLNLKKGIGHLGVQTILYNQLDEIDVIRYEYSLEIVTLFPRMKLL